MTIHVPRWFIVAMLALVLAFAFVVYGLTFVVLGSVSGTGGSSNGPVSQHTS
jgi:hypothetical protein